MISFEQFYTSIWMKVPEVWRSSDDESGRAMQVLIYTWAQHMYHYFYNKIGHMDELFDPDLCPTKYLKFLASMLGWELVGTDEKSWREQLKAAPLLYKIKGTQRGLTIAEKLVGYSVFISELYRDHLGDLVPKEKIFNNIPPHIKNKPWFKTVALDESGRPIPGTLVSDQFDSFNEGSSFLDDYGNVIRPSLDTDTDTKSYRKLSTTSAYDNISGKGSLARYAKTPRINVVLRKTDSLDTVDPNTGMLIHNNLAGALELLLQFKPFNIQINNIDVMFDVSDYIICSNLADAEALQSSETIDFCVHIEPDSIGESLLYCGGQISSTPPVEDYRIDTTLPRPLASYYSFNLDNLPKVTSVDTLLDFGFSNFSNIYSTETNPSGYCVLKGKITSIEDFLTEPNEVLYFNGEPDYVDEETRALRLSYLPVKPKFSFRYLSVPYITSHNLIDFEDIKYANRPLVYSGCQANELTTDRMFSYDLNLNFTYILDSKIYLSESNSTFKGVVRHEGNPVAISKQATVSLLTPDTNSEVWTSTYDINTSADGKYSLDLSNSGLTGLYNIRIQLASNTETLHECSLNNIKYLINSIPQNTVSVVIETPLNSSIGTINRTVNVGTPLTFEQILSDICDRFPISLILVKDDFTFVVPKTAYRYKEAMVVLDTEQLSHWIDPSATDDSFLNGCTIYTCFLEMPKELEQFNPADTLRNSYIPAREHRKFTRQYSVIDTQVLSTDAIKSEEIYIRNPETNELELSTADSRLYRKDPEYIFTRGYLANAVDVHANVPLIQKNPLNICDKHQWKVYSRMYSSYYSGSQPLTQLWWSDFYQTEADESSSYLIDYLDIDKTPEAQIRNRASVRWQTALLALDVTKPSHFLATRRKSESRSAIWTRGSAKKMAFPYEGASREKIQRNRSGITLFSRSDNMTDYAPSIVSTSGLSNYNYVLSSNTNVDVTRSYFNPLATFDSQPVPLTRFEDIDKVSIHPTIESIILNRDSGVTTYETPSSYAERSAYYSNVDGGLYQSLYAGNLPVSRDRVLSEACDFCDIFIDGAIQTNDKFVVAINEQTGSIQNTFILSYLNVYLSWFRKDTGVYLNSGMYPVAETEFAVPNVQVFVNGIEKLYNQDWTLTLDYKNTVNVPGLQPFDTVEVRYFILNRDKDVIVTDITLQESEASFIVDETMDFYRTGSLFEYDLPQNTVVTYTDSVTGQYLTRQQHPDLLNSPINYTTAYPDILVYINGIQKKYGEDWVFKHDDNANARIVLLFRASYTLTVSDTIVIRYKVAN